MAATTGQTASTFQTVLGIAKEPQPATGTPVAASDFIPVTKFDVENKVTKLQDDSWRGSMVTTTAQQNGVTEASIDVEGDAFPDTIGYFLAGMLGDVATTGTATPYTHTIALQNGGNGQPTSYTITDSDSLSTRQYASCRWTDLSLTYDAAKLLTYKATGLGWASDATTTAPTHSYSNVLPAPSWACQASINGTAVGEVESAALAFKRTGTALYTLANQRTPYEVHVGPVDLTSTVTLIAKDESALLDLLADNVSALTIDLYPANANTELKIQMSGHKWQTVKKQKGNTWIEFAGTGMAIGNTTDVGASGGYSPCLVTLINSVAAATYA